MGYPKIKTVSYDRTRNLTYFLDHNNKKLERNNQERRKSMKRIKKTLKGKGKIVAALAVVISFAAVLVWHQMQNASAHNQESPGFSRTYTNGYGRFYVDGPGNKSSWLEVKFYCSGLGKNVTQGTFNNKGRNVTFS